VETIHTFCQKLGIKTVAEMVSNEAEYNVVKSIGIDYTQGWYFSREIDSDEIVDG
jgi:EAL domain-containing protein (putative c-di-GMP-specific phosphodiesterase class I)